MTVLLVLALSPLQGPGITLPYPGLVVAAGGVLSILAGLLFLLLEPAKRARPTVFTAAAFVLWMGLTCLTTVSLYRSEKTVAAYVGGLAVLVLMTMGIRHKSHWRALAHGLLMANSLLVLYAFLTWNRTESLRGNFSNPDSFSVLPLLSVFLCLGLFSSASPGAKVLLAVEAGLMLAATVSTASRAALLGLFVGFVTLWACSRVGQRRPVPIPIGLILIVLVVLAGSGLLENTTGRVQALVEGNDVQGVAMRRDVLLYGLKMSHARPLLGWGPGTFSLAYQQYRPMGEVPETMFVNVAHNDYIEFLIETGWVGLLFWLALLVIVFKRGFRFIKRGGMASEASGAVAALAACCAFAILNFIVPLPNLVFWLFALMGLIVSVPVDATKERLPFALRVAACVLLVAAGAWACAFGARHYQTQSLLVQGRALNAELRWEEALPVLDEAIELQGVRPDLYLERALVRQGMGYLAGNPTPEQVKAINHDLEAAYALDPRDQTVVAACAKFWRAQKELTRARDVLKTAHEQIPYRTWILEDLLVVQLMLGENREAAGTIRQLTLRDDEMIGVLARFLANLERSTPGEAIALATEWFRDPTQQQLVLDVCDQAGRELLQQKQPVPAERFFRYLEKLSPDNTAVLYHLSECARLRGQKEQQKTLLEQALSSQDSKNPYYEKALEAKATDWLAQGKTDEAADLFRAFLEQHPVNTDARIFLATMLQNAARSSETREVYEQGVLANPDDARLLYAYGRFLTEEGELTLAETYVRRSLDRDPKNPEAKALLKLLNQRRKLSGRKRND